MNIGIDYKGIKLILMYPPLLAGSIAKGWVRKMCIIMNEVHLP